MDKTRNQIKDLEEKLQSLTDTVNSIIRVTQSEINRLEQIIKTNSFNHLSQYHTEE